MNNTKLLFTHLTYICFFFAFFFTSLSAKKIPLGENYQYDGNETRIVKKSSLTTTYYISPNYEEDWSDGVLIEKREYIFVNGKRIISKTEDEIKFNYSDLLGSATRVASLDGSQISSFWYSPYGSDVESIGRLDMDYKYTDQEEDATDLYYYGARYYDTDFGRFLAADSLLPNTFDSQQLNRFAYVSGNPMKLVDPTGHNATHYKYIINPANLEPALHYNPDSIGQSHYWAEISKAPGQSFLGDQHISSITKDIPTGYGNITSSKQIGYVNEKKPNFDFGKRFLDNFLYFLDNPGSGSILGGSTINKQKYNAFDALRIQNKYNSIEEIPDQLKSSRVIFTSDKIFTYDKPNDVSSTFDYWDFKNEDLANWGEKHPTYDEFLQKVWENSYQDIEKAPIEDSMNYTKINIYLNASP